MSYIARMCVWYNSSDNDVYYLSKNVGAVPMKGVDFSIEGVDVCSSFYRAGSWTVLLHTLPLATLTHTVRAHSLILIATG